MRIERNLFFFSFFFFAFLFFWLHVAGWLQTYGDSARTSPNKSEYSVHR